MEMDKVFPSKWVQASDLKGDTPVTISAIMMETVGNPPEQRPVVYFSNTDKGLVLNKTNNNTIVGLLGNESNDWIGRQITLYATTTSFGGKTVPCIRVRSAIEIANHQIQSGQSAAHPADVPPAHEYAGPESLDDEIPF